MYLKSNFGKPQYFYIALAILCLCLAGASRVLAQSSTTPTADERMEAAEERRGERQELRQEQRTEIASTTEAVRSERRAALAKRTQDRITNLAANVTNRMTAAIERLQNITSRFESRIEKLEERGVDGNAASELVRQANVALDNAEAGLVTIRIEVEEAVTSEDPQGAFKAVRGAFVATREYIREAHRLLRGALAALKEAIRVAELGEGVSDAAQSDNANETEYTGGAETEE